MRLRMSIRPGFVLSLSLLALTAAGCKGGGTSSDDDVGTDVDMESDDDIGSDTSVEIDIGVCEALLACVQDVQPAGSTALIATYSAEGTCWNLPGVEPIDCWRECRALMKSYRLLDPDAEACGECIADSDCTSPVFDSDSVCLAPGAGVCVEPFGECDLAESFPYVPPKDGACDHLPGEYELEVSASGTHGFCTVSCYPDGGLTTCPHAPDWTCYDVGSVCSEYCFEDAMCACGMECVEQDAPNGLSICAYPL